jgi:nickel/cobalt transporter (NicO) family protein
MNNSIHTIYFPAAVLLGALHAMEPGHAKALTASYLIGIKGTKRDSVILGLSVATTHSIVVILISAIGLWLGNEAFTGRATEWLETGSGLVAVAIGCWMLWRRLFMGKRKDQNEHHHHAPDPVLVTGTILQGRLEIVETPLGERMRFSSDKRLHEEELVVEIDRGEKSEILNLERSPDNATIYLSGVAPEEPHEFNARLIAGTVNQPKEIFTFSVKEPGDHHHDHDHDHLDDEAHARAHAATLPAYALKGERPSLGQIIAFGAAGGMIPCPASITVMLLALSTGRAGLGVLTVLGFSLGLAVALVGIGVIIVSGLSKLSETGRLAWATKRAPVVSAALVIVSGLFALLFAHKP